MLDETRLSSAVQSVVRELAVGQPGHWGIVTPVEDSSPAVADHLVPLLTSLTPCRPLIRVSWQEGWLFECEQANFHKGPARTFDQTTTSLKEAIECSSPDDGLARLVVACARQVPVHSLCELLKASRQRRESRRDHSLQLVLAGSWNLFAIRHHWRTTPELGGGSAPLDDKNVRLVRSPSLMDCAHHLQEKRLLPDGMTEEHELCVQLIHTATGGDADLIAYAADRLSQMPSFCALTVEEFVLTLYHQEDVVDVVRRRVASLSNAEQALLSKVLGYPYVRLSTREDTLAGLANRSLVQALELAGLVCVHRLEKGSLVLSPRSQTVFRVLSEDLSCHKDGKADASLVRNLMPLENPVSLTAWRLVAEIENALRNLAYAALVGPSQREAWCRAVGRVQSDSPGGQSRCLLAETIEQRRRQEEGGQQCSSDASPDVAYLTVGDLSALLNDTDLYNTTYKQYFPKPHELKTLLESFNTIRRAVAHNRPVCVATVDRLRHLRDDVLSHVATRFEQTYITS